MLTWPTASDGLLEMARTTILRIGVDVAMALRNPEALRKQLLGFVCALSLTG